MHQQFVAEGVKVVSDLLDSNYPVEHIYATEEWTPPTQLSSKTEITTISQNDLQRISSLKNPQQVLAICKIRKQQDINELQKEVDHNLILFLDAVRDPGNLGTIIRTADWFGIKHIICSNDTVDFTNPKVIQSTMGAIASVNIYYNEPEEFFSIIPETLPVYGLFLQGEKINNIKDKNRGIIIIGSESHGISKEVEKHITHRVTIPSPTPQNTNSESLNASVAAAIAMYHFRY
jgi:TrmH family RNA methyltransferase